MKDAYKTAVEQLYSLGHELAQGQATKFELAQVQALLAALGNPQNAFRSALIAGTNGKGSTAATLASILRAAGHRTGLFTSPHLVKVNERIQINGISISDEEFAARYQQVEATAQTLLARQKLPWHPSFFEMLTAMAFLHFAGQGIEIAVLEVGMGGRLDATNVVEPVVSVITDISMDHEMFLGHTITAIATEKAGIIHPGGKVVTLPQHPEANQVIATTAQERGASLLSAAQYVPSLDPGAAGADMGRDGRRSRYPLAVMGEQIRVDSPLVGRHQWRNLALAIAAAVELDAAGIGVTAGQIAAGIRQTRWPGRFQVLGTDAARQRPEIVLDVAHNPAGAGSLRAALTENYAGRRIVMIFGVLHDKAVREIVEILFPLAYEVHVVRAANPRAATYEEIRAAGAGFCDSITDEGSVGEAIPRVCAAAGEDSVVVITGSIYTVGEAMAAL
jgi:dihydrofolate synthase/folylpolyglutamate synthase